MPELITGTKGTPHVTSTQDRSIYEKIIGKGSYILDDNELLEPELQSNQSLRIRSGMLYHHGSITEVKRNTYDEVTIANGSQGMKRIDLVVLRYTKNPETEIEETNWVVIQGTPAANDPVAPAYTEGNMQEGDLTDDCPFCEVHLDGIQVTEVVKLMKVLDGSLESLNSNMSLIYGGGALFKVRAKPDNLIYGAYDPGIYYFEGSAQGVPVNGYNGAMLTFRESGTSNMIKIAFTADGSINRMVQRSNGEVAQNWKSVW